MLVIRITETEANFIRGVTSPGHGLQPMEVDTGGWAVPARCANDLVHCVGYVREILANGEVIEVDGVTHSFTGATKAYSEIPALAAHRASPPTKMHKLKLFDNIQIQDKPDLSVFGFRPLKIMYEDRFCDNPNTPSSTYNSTKALASLTADPPTTDRPFVVDIESWDLETETQKYIDAIKDIRSYVQNHGVELGYYNRGPVHDAYVNDGAYNLRTRNLALQSLVNELDFVAPACGYIVNGFSVALNRRFMEYSLQEARIYQKPVYMYASTRVPIGAGQYRLVTRDEWALVLEMANRYADGLIIWTISFDTTWSTDYGEMSEWWEQTEAFCERLNGV
jgi:hypothetical protein